MQKNFSLFFIPLILFFVSSCGDSQAQADKAAHKAQAQAQADKAAHKAKIKAKMAKDPNNYWQGNALWMRRGSLTKKQLKEFSYGYCSGSEEIIKPFEIVWYDSHDGTSVLRVSCI
tara:strand:+ start:239 stop:586 length:348 start_codon:yes stop_codon:yes gene_type:complete